MRFLFVLSLFISSSVLASAPCGGSPVIQWKNTDGTPGGFVGKEAKVETDAIISNSAEVCDFAEVKKGAVVRDNAHISGRAIIMNGSQVTGRARIEGSARVGGGGAITKISGDAHLSGTSTVTGASQVYGKAKITGSAKVHNSVICQASLIESISVNDSDYYCQTEDPEPPHPGSAGNKTLLGIDSDQDGVRDDVEIWINEKYSNEANKERSFDRRYMKELARIYNNLIRSHKDPVASRLNNDELDTWAYCGLSMYSPKDYLHRNRQINLVLLNSLERFSALNSASAFGKAVTTGGNDKSHCRKIKSLSRFVK